MKIAWFTEGGWQGKIPRNHRNMKTPVDWMCVMEATHYPILQIHNIQEKFDLGIVVLPKKGIDVLSQYPLVESMKKCCDKIAFMQEGPNWFFQDYSLEHQIWFYNTLMSMDWLYVHNNSDINYYKGLTGKECRVMNSTMVDSESFCQGNISDKETLRDFKLDKLLGETPNIRNFISDWFIG